MHRVTSIKPAGDWDAASATDRVVLDAGDRNRRRIVLTGEKGTEFLLDFAKPVSLRDGDGLVLDDGSIVLVAGEPEKLVEISAAARSIPCGWPGISATATPTCRSSATRSASAAITCWRICCAASARISTPLDAPFDPEAAAPHEHEHDHGA